MIWPGGSLLGLPDLIPGGNGWTGLKLSSGAHGARVATFGAAVDCKGRGGGTQSPSPLVPELSGSPRPSTAPAWPYLIDEVFNVRRASRPPTRVPRQAVAVGMVLPEGGLEPGGGRGEEEVRVAQLVNVVGIL